MQNECVYDECTHAVDNGCNCAHVSVFKGILSWSANFLYVRELILPSSETYFVSKSEVSLILNQAKTENPGTSSALKSGYPEEYLALKTGYPEE